MAHVLAMARPLRVLSTSEWTLTLPSKSLSGMSSAARGERRGAPVKGARARNGAARAKGRARRGAQNARERTDERADRLHKGAVHVAAAVVPEDHRVAPVRVAFGANRGVA